MTRIIGGSAGGRRLATPRGTSTRPSSDRVREALFSAIESWCGSLQGLRFLDLYAGSGAVGLEALSRGADHVLLVESDPAAARTIRDNATKTGLAGAEVRAEPVERLLAGGAPASPYDVVFLDPPYPTTGDEVDGNLEQLSGEWVVPGGMVVVERSSRSRAPQWPSWFSETRERKYGETTLWYGHAAHPR